MDPLKEVIIYNKCLNKYCDENKYCDKKKYCGHDYEFIISRYNKVKKFDEMRRDIFFESEDWCKNTKKLIDMYVSQKNEMKEKNKLMHDIFRKNKSVSIKTIIDDFNADLSLVDKNCNCLNKIINGRYLWSDGNGICFLAEDDNYYYKMNWYGS